MTLRQRLTAFAVTMLLGLGLAVAIGPASPAFAADPAFGPVRIIAAGSSPAKCLDVTGVSQSNGAPLQLYDCLPNQWNQQWYFYAAPGFQNYQIVPRHSWKCADVVGASQQTGAGLQQYDCLGFGQTNQIFNLTYYFNGSYIQLSPIHSWKTVTHAGLYNGSPVYQAPVTSYWITSSYLG